MAKILLVEDDINLAEQVQEFLSLENFVVELAHSGEDGLQLLSSFKFDLIILDWSLPEMSGLGVCRQYRQSGGQAPIIFLTGRDSVTAKEEGFNSGADDYLTKPFHPNELVARIKAILRRPQFLQQEILKVGDLSVDSQNYKVTKGGVSIHLRPKELTLLEFFMRHPNQFFSSKDLLDRLWRSDAEASEDTIRTSIKTLRRKITVDDEECVIKTISGRGYGLVQDG